MQRISEDNIGFAIVKRRFESAGRVFTSGEELDRDFLLRMPRGNRDAMSDSKQIEIYPRAVQRNGAVVAQGELHMRAAGIGTYDVIQGTIVATGVTKDAAQALIDAGAKKPATTKKNAQEAAPAKSKRKPAKRAKRAKKKQAAKRSKAAAKAPKTPAAESEQQNGPIL
jgi:hypothetical protein